MTLTLHRPVALQLGAGEILPLEGVRLVVATGRVWVTRRGDRDDHFLDAGDAIVLPRGARALVSGEGRATVVLRPATAAPRPAWRAAAQWLLRRRTRIAMAGT